MREMHSIFCSLVCVCQSYTNLVRVVKPCVGRIGRTVHDAKRQSHFAAKQHKVAGVNFVDD